MGAFGIIVVERPQVMFELTSRLQSHKPLIQRERERETIHNDERFVSILLLKQRDNLFDSITFPYNSISWNIS